MRLVHSCVPVHSGMPLLSDYVTFLSVMVCQNCQYGLWHAFRYNVSGRAKGADKHI